ncbi:MAG: L,D-transpeptidase family protein [Janthinobacterium lividum]
MLGIVERLDRTAFLTVGRTRVCVALGRGGVGADKREGDGVTPLGVLTLRRVLVRADRFAAGELPVLADSVPGGRIAPFDGWCDDPEQANYNTAVTLPFGGRHERLWREDGLYDIVGVLGWNDAPVIRGRGSAIFLHVVSSGFGPTEGCVAMARADLLAVLGAGLSGIEVT